MDAMVDAIQMVIAAEPGTETQPNPTQPDDGIIETQLTEEISGLWTEHTRLSADRRATAKDLRKIRASLAERLAAMKSLLSRPGRLGQWRGWLRQRGIPRSTADRLVSRHAETLCAENENVPTGAASEQAKPAPEKLAATPYTRRAQAVTWKVWEDNDCYDPACLQSLWFRIVEVDGEPMLSLNVRFRSNDAYKAAFMNMFALVEMQRRVAARVSELSGKAVKVGRYCHMADSYHIYGSYFREFEGRFLGALDKRTFEQRTLRYADVREMMEEARPAILEKAKQMGK